MAWFAHSFIHSLTHSLTHSLPHRTFAAVVFTALSLGRASSFAPDASRAQVSAARIFALFNRRPLIDSTCPDGERLVREGGRDAMINLCVY